MFFSFIRREKKIRKRKRMKKKFEIEINNTGKNIVYFVHEVIRNKESLRSWNFLSN